MIWDFLIRSSGWSILALLVVAYTTGEEFPHTHAIIGYALLALLAAGIFWALVRPQKARFPVSIFSLKTIRSLFQSEESITAAGRGFPLAVAFVVPVLAIIALCAVALMFITHGILGVTAVDEMHEVIAYFAVGLAFFYVALVVVAGGEHVLLRLQTMVGRRKHD